MKEGLKDLSTKDEIIVIGDAMALIREIILELKQFTNKYTFANEPEEIRFFKEVKPVFLSQFFYYQKSFTLKLFDSFKDFDSRRKYYHKTLLQMARFAKRNAEFYEYCMTNSSYLDSNYFTRNRRHSKTIDLDERFSTGYDAKLARILANEMLKKDILELLNTARNEGSTASSSTLTWTGSKTDLIELIYALHSVDVFNNGKGNIKAIALAFGSVFNISLGDYYRTFQDMRIRKKSQTPFLDQLRSKFLQRLVDLD